MHRKEPIYFLDDLKRTYYIMSSLIHDMDILAKDLSGEIDINEEMQRAWREKAKEGRESIYRKYLEQLRTTSGRNIENVETLCDKAEEIRKGMETVIPIELREALCEAAQRDYCFYRSCGYGKYWNEVELPEIVEILFRRFCELVESDEEGEYAVSVYDMSDMEITFAEERQVDALMEQYDLEPCEKMVKNQGIWFCC